jgi:hypothetical protein
MSKEQALLNLAKQIKINEQRGLITLKVVTDQEFEQHYGSEAWGVINLTIPESLKEHLEIEE